MHLSYLVTSDHCSTGGRIHTGNLPHCTKSYREPPDYILNNLLVVYFFKTVCLDNFSSCDGHNDTMSYKTMYDVRAEGSIYRKNSKIFNIPFLTVSPTCTVTYNCSSPAEPIMYNLEAHLYKNGFVLNILG